MSGTLWCGDSPSSSQRVFFKSQLPIRNISNLLWSQIVSITEHKFQPHTVNCYIFIIGRLDLGLTSACEVAGEKSLPVKLPKNIAVDGTFLGISNN